MSGKGPVVRRVRARFPGGSAVRHALLLGVAAMVATAAVWSGPTAVVRASADTSPPGAAAIAAMPGGSGYWIATSYGKVLSFGDAKDYGSVTSALNQPIVGMAATNSGNGYWLVAADGGIFPFGDAQGWGSTGNLALNRPIVGMAAAPAPGTGYWLVAADGGIFPFGPGAEGWGSTGNLVLNQPIVGMAAAPAPGGYWLVAADGGIFPFGPGAPGWGSTGNLTLNHPIVGMAAAPAPGGYWLVAGDGGIFPFGPGATGWGSTGNLSLNAPMVGMAAAGAGPGGYWLLGRDGGVFPFGHSSGYGSAAGQIRYGLLDVASRPECGVPQSAVLPVGKDIVMSLSCQQLTAYQDGTPLYTTFITTGRPALPTPPGQYSVLRKNSPWHMVSDWPVGTIGWYAPSWVLYTLWFRPDGYAIHDAPWRTAYGPGTEAYGSHGCVNTPMPIMASLYAWADVGTPVKVY